MNYGSKACTQKDIVVFAVPSVIVRQTANKAAKYLMGEQIIVDVTKAIEPDSLYMMMEVIRDEITR